MDIVCLDLEGVLVPEIWIAFSEATGIPELKRTTRDEPDYDKLMNFRLNILKEHHLGLKEIQNTIAGIDPLPGAKEFLDKLRTLTQVLILSDTFTEFAKPLMEKLGRAVTRWDSNGMYTGEERNVLMVAVRPREVFEVKMLLKELDQEAFVVVVPANELIGGHFSSSK